MPPKNETVTPKPTKKGETSKPSVNSTPTQRGENSKKDSIYNIPIIKKSNLPAAANAGPPVPKDWDVYNFSMYGFDEKRQPVEYGSTHLDEFYFVSTQHTVFLCFSSSTGGRG